MGEAQAAFLKDVSDGAERGDPPVPLNHIIMGDDFPEIRQNSGRMIREGRTVEHMILAEKP